MLLPGKRSQSVVLGFGVVTLIVIEGWLWLQHRCVSLVTEEELTMTAKLSGQRVRHAAVLPSSGLRSWSANHSNDIGDAGRSSEVKGH